MRVFLYLLSLLALAGAQITFQTVSSGSVNFTTPSEDFCNKLIVRSSSVHHVNTRGIY